MLSHDRHFLFIIHNLMNLICLCRLLAPNIGKLPMPEDYYLQELRELTRNYMLEISA